MILPFDITPNKSLYIIGAEVLQIFHKESVRMLDIKILFDKLNMHRDSQISFNYFLYTLDWLFLTNTIDLQNNYVRICS